MPLGLGRWALSEESMTGALPARLVRCPRWDGSVGRGFALCPGIRELQRPLACPKASPKAREDASLASQIGKATKVCLWFCEKEVFCVRIFIIRSCHRAWVSGDSCGTDSVQSLLSVNVNISLKTKHEIYYNKFTDRRAGMTS